MKFFSQRCIFTALMTLLATLSGSAYGAYELRRQSDIIADIIKISALIGIATLCVSFMFWTVTHLKKDSVFRGGLAGLLTGLAIVPVPYFVSGLKTEFFRLYALGNSSVLSFFEAIPFAVQTGLATFLIISKVSIIAVISSLVLGIIIAKRVPLQPDQ